MNDRAPVCAALAAVGLALLFGACASPPPPVEETPQPEPVFEGTRDVIAANDTSIRYDARGDGKPTLVFVHGWCGNRRYWRNQVAAFSDRYRVVTLDLGGHGESGRSRKDWSLASFAVDVEAVFADLDLHDVILVAHSTGASVALQVAETLRWRVIGVVGVDALQDVSLVWDDSTLETSVRAMRSDFQGFVESFVRGQCAPDADPALVAELTREMGATDPHIALRVLAAFAQYDNKAALERCPVPVLCINAEGINATNVQENRKYSPAFSAVVLKGAGRFLMLERTEEFNRELEHAVATLLHLRDRR